MAKEPHPMLDIQTLADRLLFGRNQQLSWGWVANVVDPLNAEPLAVDQCYFRLRLAEMFTRNKRVLWSKFYPMVHAFVQHDGALMICVAGPGQLKGLGDANLDRLIGLDYPLSELTVFRGDIDLLIGLYAVPGDNAAKLLLSSVSQLSVLTGLSAALAAGVADIIRQGVEGMMTLDKTSLQLGVRYTLSSTDRPQRAKAGFLAAINAPSGAVDYNRLWIKEGRLRVGENPVTAVPYAAHDYMLLEVERRDGRDDWRAVPAVAQHEKTFDAILRSGDPVDKVAAALNKALQPFYLDVRGSRDLTAPDKDRALINIKAGLQKALDEMRNNGELRGLDDDDPLAHCGVDVGVFDLLKIEDNAAKLTADERRAALDRAL
jgi:hypothetical protein